MQILVINGCLLVFSVHISSCLEPSLSRSQCCWLLTYVCTDVSRAGPSLYSLLLRACVCVCVCVCLCCVCVHGPLCANSYRGPSVQISSSLGPPCQSLLRCGLSLCRSVCVLCVQTFSVCKYFCAVSFKRKPSLCALQNGGGSERAQSCANSHEEVHAHRKSLHRDILKLSFSA